MSDRSFSSRSGVEGGATSIGAARRSTGPLPNAAAAFVALTWLGMLAGVSFLATPVKFQAPSLDLAVALEVGRVTFDAFSKMEWGLAALLVMATCFAPARRVEIVFAGVAILIVAVQGFWLLPVLDARIDAVIAGQPKAPSMHHMLYAALEAAKGVALVGLALVALFRLGWQAGSGVVEGRA